MAAMPFCHLKLIATNPKNDSYGNRICFGQDQASADRMALRQSQLASTWQSIYPSSCTWPGSSLSAASTNVPFCGAPGATTSGFALVTSARRSTVSLIEQWHRRFGVGNTNPANQSELKLVEKLNGSSVQTKRQRGSTPPPRRSTRIMGSSAAKKPSGERSPNSG